MTPCYLCFSRTPAYTADAVWGVWLLAMVAIACNCLVRFVLSSFFSNDGSWSTNSVEKCSRTCRISMRVGQPCVTSSEFVSCPSFVLFNGCPLTAASMVLWTTAASAETNLWTKRTSSGLPNIMSLQSRRATGSGSTQSVRSLVGSEANDSPFL